jgi:hypothetical protein
VMKGMVERDFEQKRQRKKGIDYIAPMSLRDTGQPPEPKKSGPVDTLTETQKVLQELAAARGQTLTFGND